MLRNDSATPVLQVSTSSPSTPAAPAVRTGRGRHPHGRPAWERADLAARDYLQRRPIERPTLPALAVTYRVSVARVRRRIKGADKPQPAPPPTLAEQIRNASPEELIRTAKEVGIDLIWDRLSPPSPEMPRGE